MPCLFYFCAFGLVCNGLSWDGYMTDGASYNGGCHSGARVLAPTDPQHIPQPQAGHTASLRLGLVTLRITRLGWRHGLHVALFRGPLEGTGEMEGVWSEAKPHPQLEQLRIYQLFVLGSHIKVHWKKGSACLKMFKKHVSNFLPPPPNPTCYKLNFFI